MGFVTDSHSTRTSLFLFGIKIFISKIYEDHKDQIITHVIANILIKESVARDFTQSKSFRFPIACAERFFFREIYHLRIEVFIPVELCFYILFLLPT